MLKKFFKKLELAYLIFIKPKKNINVELSDGCNLYVDIFTPKGKGPWPVILTAVPYHKDDVAGASTILEAYYYLKAGYVNVLADLRGHGSAEGITQNPLDCLNGNDLYELVEWCGIQKWSNGKVGMKGESYGGMTSLSAASMNPPSLKAIYSFMAPAFFYRNLAFPGGSLNMIGMCGAWLGFMNLITLFPPFYIKNRPDWLEVWQKRLESYIPYLINPSDHITYDDYWKKVDIPVHKIQVPTRIMEGWWDFARDDGFQIYDKIQGPKSLCIGPWVHIFPSYGMVEQIDEIQDAIRWFDYWMRKRDMDIHKAPPLSIHVMGTDFWKYEKEWPPKRAIETSYHLHCDNNLSQNVEKSKKELDYSHVPSVGISSGYMIVYPLGLDYPKDQAEDNSKSLIFDTAPMEKLLEIVGKPFVNLILSTDMPDALISVKLCDVSPDGKSNLITSGTRRLSFRESDEHPEMPQANKKYKMSIDFFNTDYQIKPGNRLRLAIALSDFPRVFPLPYQGKITLYFGPEEEQSLILRTLIDEKPPEKPPEFKSPDVEFMKYLMKDQSPLGSHLEVVKEEASKKIIVSGKVEFKIPLLHLKKPLKLKSHYDAFIIEGKPDSAKIEAKSTANFQLDNHEYNIEVNQIVKSENIKVSAEIEKDGEKYYNKDFQKHLFWTSLKEKQ